MTRRDREERQDRDAERQAASEAELKSPLAVVVPALATHQLTEPRSSREIHSKCDGKDPPTKNIRETYVYQKCYTRRLFEHEIFSRVAIPTLRF